MIDLAITLMQLFGPNVASKLRDLRKQRLSKKADERRALEASWASPESMVELVTAFYCDEIEENGVRQYVLTCDGIRIPTAVYIEPRGFRVQRPPVDVPYMLKGIDPSLSYEVEPFGRSAEYAAEVADRLELMEIKLWDDPLYQILGVHSSQGLSFVFTEVPFMKWRFTSGLLPDELTDALISTKGNLKRILTEADNILPFRAKFLPSRNVFFDFSSRLCCGGFGLMVAIARRAPDSDYVLPVQVRSEKVSDGRGLLAVVPKAFHQGAVGADVEVNVYWSAMREIYEELYNGEEVRRQDKRRLRHDWYMDRHLGMRYFRDNEGTYDMELVSFGVNAIGGNFEHALLLVIRDTSYWDRFGGELRANWEATGLRQLSSRAPVEIKRAITKERWATESVFHLGEALLRLQQLSPHRVDLPNLAVELK